MMPVQPPPHANSPAFGNPYAPPQACTREAVHPQHAYPQQTYPQQAWAQPVHPAPSPYEAIRRANIKAESNVRNIGVLCIVGGVLALLSVVDNKEIVDMVSAGVGGGLVLAAGGLLRQLHPVGRILYSVAAILGLFMNAALFVLTPTPLLLPIVGTQIAVAALFLYLLWNGTASIVFSETYRREVVAATRHVKAVSTPLVIGAFLLMFVASVATGVIAVASSL